MKKYKVVKVYNFKDLEDTDTKKHIEEIMLNKLPVEVSDIKYELKIGDIHEYVDGATPNLLMAAFLDLLGDDDDCCNFQVLAYGDESFKYLAELEELSE